MPDFCSSRSFFSMRSHKPTSGSIPVNIGVGNIMNSCFADRWTTLAAVGVSSIAAPGPAWPNSNDGNRLAFHVCPNREANGWSAVENLAALIKEKYGGQNK